MAGPIKSNEDVRREREGKAPINLPIKTNAEILAEREAAAARGEAPPPVPGALPVTASPPPTAAMFGAEPPTEEPPTEEPPTEEPPTAEPPPLPDLATMRRASLRDLFGEILPDRAPDDLDIAADVYRELLDRVVKRFIGEMF